MSVWASQVALVVKNPLAIAGDTGDLGSTPGLGRSPGEGNGNPLQYFCLGNPMDRGAWLATIHGVTRVRHDSATKHTHIVCMNNFHQVTEDYDYRVISMLHLFSFCMHSSVHLGYNFA